MRAMSAATSSGISLRRSARMFIGNVLRSAVKPLCISAEIDRADRACRAVGRPQPRRRKALGRYSQMASESHTTRSPWRSAGTRPDGDWRLMRSLVSPWRSGTTTSSNGSADVLEREVRAQGP
jgi:hypothetical protein